MTAASVSAPEVRDLLDRRLLIVTGKGGTGKSTVAAALAALAATGGRRVLLCDIDGKSAAAATLGAGVALDFEPTEIAPNLWAMSMDTEQALREYLRLFSPVPVPGAVGPLAAVIDFVADAAPGVREILVIGKLCWEVREARFDLVVVDAEATGHIVSQIAAPRTLADLVPVGMIRDQTEWMRGILDDPATTSAIVVTTPEELPVTETIEVLRRLGTETSTAVAAVVVNRMPLPLLGADDRWMLGRDEVAASAAGAVLAWADGRRRDAEDLRAELDTARRELDTARRAGGIGEIALIELPEIADPSPAALGPHLLRQMEAGRS